MAYMCISAKAYMRISSTAYMPLSAIEYMCISAIEYIHVYISNSIHVYISNGIHVYISNGIHVYISNSVHVYISNSIHVYISKNFDSSFNFIHKCLQNYWFWYISLCNVVSRWAFTNRPLSTCVLNNAICLNWVSKGLLISARQMQANM